MRLRIFFGFLLVFVFAEFLSAKEAIPTRDFYLILNYNRSKVELGEYSSDKLRMKMIRSSSLINVDKEMLKKCFELKSGEEVLIYLHCWLGNERTFHKITLRGLNTVASGKQTAPIRKIISIIWKSKVGGYAFNWQEAEKSGRKLQKVVSWISELSNGKVNVFCHSMGNRVFEGIVREISLTAPKKPLFREVVLAAPDLNTDIFEKNLKTIPSIATRVHVFRHRRDRLLMLSQIRMGRGRLGLAGPDKMDALLSGRKNLYIVDATQSGKMNEPSNHLYFHSNDLVKEHLARIFSHQPLPTAQKERVIYLKAG